MRVLPPTAPKIIPRLLSGRKCSGVSNCGRLGRCIVQRLCATAIVHPCTSCLLCWFRIVRNFGQALSRILAFAVVGVGASLRRQPFVPLRLCIDSHLCRCIVQRLCVAVFMHPCITTLCDRYRASLHVYERSVGFASCETLSVHFIRHPCTTRKLRVLPPTNTQKV